MKDLRKQIPLRKKNYYLLFIIDYLKLKLINKNFTNFSLKIKIINKNGTL